MAGRDHAGEEVGSRGQHLWRLVKKTSACPCFTPCQAPPEAWAPPQPLHHTGCPESPCKAPGRGAQAAQRFAASPSAEAPHGGLRKASEGVCFLRGRDWQDGAVLLAWGPCAQQTGSVCGGGGHPGLACSARTPRCSVPLLPRIPVCSDPPLPVLVLQMSMKQVLEGGKLQVPDCSPSPCNSIFLLVLLKRVWTQQTSYLI